MNSEDIHPLKLEDKTKENVSEYCSILRFNDKLSIYIDMSKDSRCYRGLLLMFSPLYLFFFYGLGTGGIIDGIIAIIIVSSFIIPSAIPYLYYKNQTHKWIFNKTTQSIKFLKILAHFKKVKDFNFSEVSSLIYRHDTKYLDPYYALFIVLRNDKMISIYIGKKNECINLGNEISEFIEIPFFYKPQLKIYYE